jgi:ABC-type amino acid transport substrate-binding protein
MANTKVLEKRLAFRQRSLEKLYEAYEALVSGRVKSYMVDDRQLTYQSLPDLYEEIQSMEAEVDSMTAQLNGAKPRKVFGVVPRDW